MYTNGEIPMVGDMVESAGSLARVVALVDDGSEHDLEVQYVGRAGGGGHGLWRSDCAKLVRRPPIDTSGNST